MNQPATPTPPIPEPPHPRDVAADAAGHEIQEWVRDWTIRHQLTSVEFLHIMLTLMRIEIRGMGIAERNALLAAAAKQTPVTP